VGWPGATAPTTDNRTRARPRRNPRPIQHRPDSAAPGATAAARTSAARQSRHGLWRLSAGLAAAGWRTWPGLPGAQRRVHTICSTSPPARRARFPQSWPASRPKHPPACRSFQVPSLANLTSQQAFDAIQAANLTPREEAPRYSDVYSAGPGARFSSRWPARH